MWAVGTEGFKRDRVVGFTRHVGSFKAFKLYIAGVESALSMLGTPSVFASDRGVGEVPLTSKYMITCTLHIAGQDPETVARQLIFIPHINC